MSTTNPPTPTLLLQHLQTTQPPLPTPHPLFLTSILTPIPTNPSAPSTSARLPPLPALAATARHRLLSSDITQPHILSPSTPSFPSTVNDVSIPEKILTEDIPVQVLDISDIGHSKWEEIERLEAERKGEGVRGREVIRVVPADIDAGAAGGGTGMQQAASTMAGRSLDGPFKLLLQDVKGRKVEAFELKKVAKIAYPSGMGIGCKLVVKTGTRVARGTVLLEEGRCVVLGGRVEKWDAEWRAGREGRLRGEVERAKAEREGGGVGGAG